MAIQVVTSENLAEFNAQRLGLSEPKVEEKPAQPVSSQEPNPPEAAPTSDDEPHRKPKLEARFSELTEKRRAAEENAAAAEARARAAEERAAAAEAKLNPPRAPEFDPDIGPKPLPADYTDAFKYAEDLSEWSSKRALKESKANDAADRAKAEAAKVQTAFRERAAAFALTAPDYPEVLRSASHLSVSDDVRDAILESDIGPKILYHLATHHDDVAKLNAFGSKGALKLLGRIEAQLEAKDARKEASAPAPAPRIALPEPIAPIRANAAATDNKMDAAGQFTGSFADWKALRKAGKI